MRLVLAAAALVLGASTAFSQPRVVASIVPVHAIVSAVMGDKGQPELLLKGALSEHRAAFTPSQLATLGEADLVFIVGHGLEAKLSQLSGSEAVNGKTFVELAEAPGVKTLPVRAGGGFEAHDHAHEGGAEDDHGHEDEGHAEEGHDHEPGVLSFDPHVWLDPENARAMAEAVAVELGRADPSNAPAYAANAKAFSADITALTGELASELAPVRDKPFIVFHDAYQYFEARFGLTARGSITDVSDKPPSAQRLAEIRAKLADSRAVCVFREPQYDGRTVAAVIEGSGAREGVLDPLGADLTPGPGAYRALLTRLAGALRDCLAG